VTRIVLKMPTFEALQKKWNQHLKHGVIFASVHPVPKEGEDVEVTLQPGFSPTLVTIAGYVAQASVGISVIQLRGLDATARERLVELGIAEAADALVGDETSSTGSHAPVEEQEAAPVAASDPAPAPEEPAEAAVEPAAEAAPEAVEEAAAGGRDETPPQPAPKSKFTPKAAKFSPGGGKFTPKAAKFSPGGAKFTPGGASFKPRARAAAPAQAPPKVGDLTDIRVVAGLGGPASKTAEALMPAAASKGVFGDETWRDVVLQLTTDRATGILVVHAFREIRWAYFVDGGPVHFAGDTPHAGEYLSDALVAGGLDMAVWVEGVRMSKLLGMRAGEYLVSQGKLTRATLDAALSKRAERITRNLIGTNFGTWSFHDVPAVRSIFRNTPVNAVEVLMDSERKAQAARDNELLIRECEPFYKHHVKLVQPRKHLFKQLKLKENESFVVFEMIPAGWTIGELVAYGGMLERPLLRLLSALEGMGLVEFVEEEGEISKRNRAERTLWLGKRDLERRDSFEALYAHWSSTPYELKMGYERVLAEYGMERFGKVADSRIKELMAEIKAKADALFKQLSDKRGRKAARKGHVGDDQLLMAVDLLDKQAQMALFKNDFAYVKACYERVLDLDPGVAEAGEARRNARQAMSRPEIAKAKQPGEGRMQALFKQMNALGTDD